ncbi:MAG: hypothetical protein Cpurp_12855 [Chlorogloea purpurea SAG 13.99]|nr:hypothetical protein [Chlorogloea purpurea SAG 13.99]
MELSVRLNLKWVEFSCVPHNKLLILLSKVAAVLGVAVGVPKLLLILVAVKLKEFLVETGGGVRFWSLGSLDEISKLDVNKSILLLMYFAMFLLRFISDLSPSFKIYYC